MSFLSTLDMAQMRADALDTLADDTCTILRSTVSVNAIGEQVLTWGTAGTAVPCRLRPSGRAPDTRPVGGQEETIAPWAVTLPHGTAVNPGDRLVIDTVTYEVTQSWDEETWKTASRVEAMRIE